VLGCVDGLVLRIDTLARSIEDAIVALEVAGLDLVGHAEELGHIRHGIGGL
jgi:hypothetical protein